MALPGSCKNMRQLRLRIAPRLRESGLHPMCCATIYPSGLCLVMEILRGFGSEISDRDAQSPRTSRDIVLCHPQALQEGGESIFEIETREYPCSLGGLANGSICTGKKPSRARDRTTWLSIIHFEVDSFPLHGAGGRSQYYVGAASAHCAENTRPACWYPT